MPPARCGCPAATDIAPSPGDWRCTVTRAGVNAGLPETPEEDAKGVGEAAEIPKRASANKTDNAEHHENGRAADQGRGLTEKRVDQLPCYVFGDSIEFRQQVN